MTKEKEMEAKSLFSRLPPPDQAEVSTLFQTSPMLQPPPELGTSDHHAFCSQRPWWRDSHMLTWVPSVAQIL